MSKTHILIVDDEKKVAFFLGKALERSNQNYRVTTVHSGEKALQVLKNSPVDLLITDLRMPGISGLELIRWVRGSSPGTRTILITAYGNNEIEKEAQRLEAYRYITKPFQMTDFARVVQDALRDVTAGRSGLLVLSDQSFEAISKELNSLRVDIGARCIFLSDMQGQLLTQVGDIQKLDTVTLITLLGSSFATSGELARLFGNGKAVNLNFHEGSKYEIYSANVGDNLFLAIVYNRGAQASRIGVVWLYTQRTIQRLISILSAAQSAPQEQPLNADFGTSLLAELDTLFDDSSTGIAAPPASQPQDSTSDLPAQPSQAANTNQKHQSPEESAPPAEQEVFDLQTAIERGLISPDLIQE
jgi:DNA-binding response OmpR family regulator